MATLVNAAWPIEGVRALEVASATPGGRHCRGAPPQQPSPVGLSAKRGPQIMQQRMRLARRPVVIVVSIYALLVCALWWRVFLKHQVCAWDCVLEYWPDLRFETDSIRNGGLPLWCPWSLGGYPFYADLQSGLYAPVNWICIVAGVIAGAGAWTIQLKVMLTMLVGLCGMHWLSYARTRSHAAAFVAAITYVVGSPVLVHKNGAFLWPLMYLPFAVLAVGAFFDRPTLRRASLLAIALWLCGSAGHPQGFFYDLVVVTIYAGYRFIALGPERWLRFLRTGWTAVLLLIALCVALLFVMYWPSLTAIPLSERATRDLAYVVEGYIAKRSLYELFVPNLDGNWQWDVYVGPLALVGVGWALIRAESRNARIELFLWAAIAWLGMDLALGRDGHTLEWFYRHVPGFTLFRIPYRHKVIFGFAAALLAGDGVAAAANARNWRETAWMGSFALIWFIYARGAPWGALIVGQLAILTIALLRRWRSRWRWVLDVVVCAAVFFDLWHAGAGKLAILQDYPRGTYDRIMETMPGVHDRWRYQVDDVSLPNGGTLPYAAAYTNELRELSGYSNPITFQRALDVQKRALTSPLLLTHYGVRYELGARARTVDARPLAHVRGYEYRDVAPIARAYGAAVRIEHPEDILRLLGVIAPSSLTTAYVEQDAPHDLPSSAFAPVDGTVVSYEAGRVEIKIHLPAPGVVVVNESWFPGWDATVNGHSAETFRANYLLIGVLAPAGDSELVLEFRPPHYRAELLLFVLGLLAAIALVLLDHIRE